MLEEFDKNEIEALRKIAKERIAYDTITSKIKNTWIWVVASGLLTLYLLWDKIFTGVK